MNLRTVMRSKTDSERINWGLGLAAAAANHTLKTVHDELVYNPGTVYTYCMQLSQNYTDFIFQLV